MSTPKAADWPRDFIRPDEDGGGYMFLGSALRWTNKALWPRDYEDNDILLPTYFIDRPDGDNPHLFESFESQRWAYMRGEQSRQLIHDHLKRGRLTAFRLPNPGGDFEPVPRLHWGQVPRRLRHLGLRRRFSTRRGAAQHALRKFRVDGEAVLYLQPEPLVEVLRAANPQVAHLPVAPSRTLDTGDAATGDRWPMLAAVVWIATRNAAATAGAAAYIEDRERSRLGTAALETADTYLREQIADFFCTCSRPVCQCWSRAVTDLKARVGGRDSAISAFGFAFDQGDEQPVPPSAWRGSLTGAYLGPEKPSGTRWGGISFYSDEVRAVFPAEPGTPALAVTPRQMRSWKDWALDAVGRGVAVREAHSDARAQLPSDHLPSRDQARELLKEAMGVGPKRGRPSSSRT